MSRQKLVSRVVKKLESASVTVAETDHDNAEEVENEINEIIDLVRQLKNHLNYLEALQPVARVQIALAFGHLAIGDPQKAVATLHYGVADHEVSKEARHAMLEEFEQLIRLREEDMRTAISSLESP